MTFTDKQQKDHRAAFIHESRQKAWGAACNADWIAKSLDELMAQYKKLQEDDRTLEADIKELEGALDSHTVDNRNKRKALQEKRNNLTKVFQTLAQNMQLGQQTMRQLQQTIETNLQLAKHAETWAWKEVERTLS